MVMTMKKKARHPRKRRFDRGSALLVSLMVMVGLSLLGLAFVAISESESAIAMNEMHAAQVQAIAEAGSRAVMEWFQNPQWAVSQGILPANVSSTTAVSSGLKRIRTVSTYTGVYKQSPSEVLFDLPLKGAANNRFYGDEATADFRLNDAVDTALGTTVLANINTRLFGANRWDTGRITDIRVYAPPTVGGTLTGGFWIGGTRYGVATIRVTAQKRRTNDATSPLIAERVVRLIVGEFPLPIPDGPIQTTDSAGFGGSFTLRWGKQTSFTNLTPNNTAAGIPWQNPYDRIHFERGYDEHSWPMSADPFNPNVNFLAEVVGKTFDDPWYGARSRGTVTGCADCAGYSATDTETTNLQYTAFQNQDDNVYPTKKLVRFPDIRYETYKRVALAGAGNKGVYYFEWTGTGQNFRKRGSGIVDTAAHWVNTLSESHSRAPLSPGFFFFDAKNGQNPQNVNSLDGTITTDTTKLIPTDANDKWSSSDVTEPFLMQGFVYINYAIWGTTGGGKGPVENEFAMPGEIYRDIGHRRLSTPYGPTSTWVEVVPGVPLLDNAANGQHDYIDLNGNGKLDIVTWSTTATSNEGGTPTARAVRLPKVWRTDAAAVAAAPYNSTGCTVPAAAGTGAYASSACSEPHEPFLNFAYPDNATDGIVVQWEDDRVVTNRKPKKRGMTCTDATPADDCTSNAFDLDGGLVDLTPHLDGILYNEGEYTSQGNVHYYGAVLIRNEINATGTPNIWFKGSLERGLMNIPGMPRVIVYSAQTDEGF
jgi:hypothetical protein